MGDRLGGMGSCLSLVSFPIYRSDGANRWQSLAPTISKMSYEVLCETI